MAHSSSGQGRRPLKAEITGSTPVCATNPNTHILKLKPALYAGLPSIQAQWRPQTWLPTYQLHETPCLTAMTQTATWETHDRILETR